MPIPSDLPTWASDATYASGPDVGENTRLAPTSGEKATGYIRGRRPPARKLNWILGLLCDWVAHLRTPVTAWISLDNVATNVSTKFTLVLKSSYPSGSWTLVDDVNLQVPEPGLYRVDFVALIDSTDETSYLETAIVCGFSIVGYVLGWRIAAQAAPAHVIGSALVPIVGNLTTQRLAFMPQNGGPNTPETEASVGRAHQIMITKVGDL